METLVCGFQNVLERLSKVENMAKTHFSDIFRILLLKRLKKSLYFPAEGFLIKFESFKRLLRTD